MIFLRDFAWRFAGPTLDSEAAFLAALEQLYISAKTVRSLRCKQRQASPSFCALGASRSPCWPVVFVTYA